MKVSELLKITIEHHLRKPGGTITQDSSRFLCVAAGYAASSAASRRAAYGRLKGHIDDCLGETGTLEEWLYVRLHITSPDPDYQTPELADAVQEHRIAWATKMMEEFAARGD